MKHTSCFYTCFSTKAIHHALPSSSKKEQANFLVITQVTDKKCKYMNIVQAIQKIRKEHN
jgi:hypothetical protein